MFFSLTEETWHQIYVTHMFKRKRVHETQQCVKVKDRFSGETAVKLECYTEIKAFLNYLNDHFQ